MRYLEFAVVSTCFTCIFINSLSADTSQIYSDKLAQQISQTNIQGKIQPKSLSSSVDHGFTLDGSLIYWNAKIEGYDFAERAKVKGISNTGEVPQSVKAKLKVESPSFDRWDPGFQVGLGYIFSGREQWQTHLSWTRFNTESHESIRLSTSEMPTEYLVQLWVPFITGPIGDRIKADWNLDFDTLDFELNRPYFVGKWLSLKPTVGLRAAWIDQHFKIKQHSGFPTSDGGILLANTSFKAHQDFKGVGIRIGSDAHFYLTRYWSILGNLSTSLLWGKASLREKAKGLIAIDSENSFPEIIFIKKTADVLRANIETQLGFEWQAFYYKDKFRFAFSTLYTFAYWFRQNSMVNELITPNFGLSQPHIYALTNNGDLQIQGVNIKFEFDF